MRFLRSIIGLIVVCLGFSLILGQLVTNNANAYYNPGTPTGYVSDYGEILSTETEALLERFLAEFEASDSTQIAVVTIPSMNDDYIEHFAVKLFAEWGIGRADVDNGALLLIAVEDRKMRIEVGYGLEGHLTNAESSSIIRNILTPAFKAGNFEGGVSDAVAAMVSATEGAYNAPEDFYKDTSTKDLILNAIFFFFIWGFGFFVPMIGAAALTEKIWPGGLFGGVIGFVSFAVLGLFSWLFLGLLVGGGIGLGLLVDHFVSRAKFLDTWRGNLRTAKKTGKGMGIWFGGRGGRGGSGGGGFGGFGGGMSGGGGASGGW